MRYYVHHDQIELENMSLPLTRQVYDAVVTSPCVFSTLQLMPDDASASQIAVSDSPHTETRDIGFTKKTYLLLFTEGHHHFQNHPIGPASENLHSLTDAQLESLYMATISILITTNEYSTVWTLHAHILGEKYVRNGIGAFVDDFRFCLALATSRLARVNKSLSLWLWLRKLAAVLVFQRKEVPYTDLVRHVLKSMELHFANYCAGFTLVWLVDIGEKTGLQGIKHTLPLLRKACRRNLHDITLWNTLLCILQGKCHPYSMVHYQDVCRQMESVLAQNVQNSAQGAPLDAGTYLGTNGPMGDLRWLVTVECTVASPYRCMLGSMDDCGPGIAIIEEKISQIERLLLSESGERFYQRLEAVLLEYKREEGRERKDKEKIGGENEREYWKR